MVETRRAEADRAIHVTFSTSEKLRNAFKAKAATEGKTIKELFERFMKGYIEQDADSC